MWPLVKLDNNIVTMTFHPQHLCLSWITHKKGRAPLALQAYKRFPLHNLELERLTIFNPTQLKKMITSFLSTHKLNNAFVIFGLSGPGIKEKMVTVSHASPTPDDFALPISKDLLWDFQYLYPKDNSQFVFYVYGIPQHILFQYQLLAIAAKLNVIKITPARVGLFNAYQFLFGDAFRQGQLALDMIRNHNMIEQVFTNETITRMIEISPDIDKKQEQSHILQACGLFVSERSRP